MLQIIGYILFIIITVAVCGGAAIAGAIVNEKIEKELNK